MLESVVETSIEEGVAQTIPTCLSLLHLLVVVVEGGISILENEGIFHLDRSGRGTKLLSSHVLSKLHFSLVECCFLL